MNGFAFMRFPGLGLILAASLLLIGCGGGGGGGSSEAPNSTGEGGLTVLVGDGPLDNVESVLLDLEEVILLGSGGQREVLIQGGMDRPIDLLRLRNLTERIFDGDIAAGDYNKIRMIINYIEIIEAEGDTPIPAQLPAGGKIDVNPQGPFEIVDGEDLVIEIDFELDRAVHVVLTGNSKYKFRPVVFVDVIDQAKNARLTHIFGQVDQFVDYESPFAICEADDDEDCSDIVPIVLPADATRFVDQDNNPLLVGDLMNTDMVHAFGHYYIEGEADPGEPNVVRFRPILVIKGAEDAIQSIEGDVIEPSAGLIPLDTIDDEIAASDTDVITMPSTLVVNKIGAPMVPATGQEAEAWGLSSQITMDEFPAFLVLLSENDAEEIAEGLLVSVDGDMIVLNDEDDGDICVIYQGAEDTKIFQVTEGVDESDGTPIGIADLLALVDTIPTPEVSVFGEIVDGCVVANSIIVEIDD